MGARQAPQRGGEIPVSLARSAFAPRHKNRGRTAEKSAPGYLKWLRGRRCAACVLAKAEQSERTEAAHVDHGGDKGMGTKASDRFAIPLCGGPAGHHAEQHRLGWHTFEGKYHFDARMVASMYWSNWPGRHAWEAKHG